AERAVDPAAGAPSRGHRREYAGLKTRVQKSRRIPDERPPLARGARRGGRVVRDSEDPAGPPRSGEDRGHSRRPGEKPVETLLERSLFSGAGPDERRLEDRADAAARVRERDDPVPDAPIDRQQDVAGPLVLGPSDSVVVREEGAPLQPPVKAPRPALAGEQRLLSRRVHDDPRPYLLL